jgi:PKD domain
MRTMLRSKLSLLFMMLGMLLAVPAVAFAADVVSDVNADLSSDVTQPTEVSPNDPTNAFDIKVWATGTLNNISSRPGTVEVTKNYETFLDATVSPAQWKIRGGSLATDKVTLNFKAELPASAIANDRFNYTSGQDCPQDMPANQGTGTKGCKTNPFIVEANLNVGNVPNGTTLKLTDAMAGTNALEVTTDPNSSKYSLDSGFVKVVQSNQTPTANAGGSYTFDEGSETNALSGSGTDPEDDVASPPLPLSYAWDLDNNGSFETSGQNPNFAATNIDGPATRTVTLRVTDSGGLSDTDSATVTIDNVDPTLSALSLTGNTGTACLSGNTLKLSFSFSDPASADTHTGSIDWGDSSANTAFTSSPQTDVEHSYSPGTYTINVSVSDDDDGTDSDTAQVSRLYNMSGILSPFNATQPYSIFKYGSTVPVKVQITDCNNNPVSGLAPKLSVSKTSGDPPVTSINESVDSTSAADSGSVLRYSDPQYIFNMNTKSSLCPDSTATYRAIVKGTTTTGQVVTNPAEVSQQFSLKAK